MQEKGELSNFQTVFGVKEIPEATQLREVMDKIPSKSIRPYFDEVFKRLQRGKHLEQFQDFKGKYLVSIDGTQYFSALRRSRWGLGEEVSGEIV